LFPKIPLSGFVMKRARNSIELERIRRRIIEAALVIIVEEGLPSLTMRKLGSRLHMSAPNLYNFFQSKEEIYISIVIMGFQMLYDELERSCVSNPDPASRALALIDAYVNFGITNKTYYDIMFTRPFPRYNDYIGTPYEKISAIEHKISIDIVRIAMDALKGLKNGSQKIAADDLVHSIVKIWSMLHGMVSLANSNIMGYVTPDLKNTYSRITNELIEQYRA
jgi:AcrR family transcriptional regulator